MGKLEEYLRDLEILLAEYQSMAETGWNNYENEMATAGQLRTRAEKAESAYTEAENTRKQESQRFTQQLDALRKELGNASKTFQVTIDEKNRTITRMENDIKEKDKLIKKKEDDLATLRDKHTKKEDLAKQLKDKEEEIKKLEQTIATLQAVKEQNGEIGKIHSILEGLQETVNGWGSEGEVSKVVLSAYEELQKHIPVNLPKQETKEPETSPEPPKTAPSPKPAGTEQTEHIVTEDEVLEFLKNNTGFSYRYLEQISELIATPLKMKGKKIVDKSAGNSPAADAENTANSSPEDDASHSGIDEESVLNYLKSHSNIFRSGGSGFDVFKTAVRDNINRDTLVNALEGLEDLKKEKIQPFLDKIEEILNKGDNQ